MIRPVGNQTVSKRRRNNRKIIRGKRQGGSRLLAFEPLEARHLLTAGVFLQGTAFLGNAHLAGATVNLYASDGTTLLGTATTDSNGQYLFDDAHNVASGNLQPGTYILKETPPAPDTLTGAHFLTDVDTASVDPSTHAITVTISDPSTWKATFNYSEYNSPFLGENVDISIYGNVESGGAARLPMHLSPPLPSTTILPTYCTDLFNGLSASNNQTYTVLAGTAPAGPTGVTIYHAGEIAYLYNHYGKVDFADNTIINGDSVSADDQYAGLALAIWELEYDSTPDLASGNFIVKSPSPTANPPAGAIVAANNFLSLAAGQSETALFLNMPTYPSAPETTNTQGFVLSRSFDFDNKTTPGINTTQQPASASVRSSIADKATVTGLVSPSSGDTVTFNLYSSATTQNSSTLLFTDTETVSISGSTGTATSKGYTATAAATGTVYWVATFSGDSNNAAVASGLTDEPVTITGGAPDLAITKTADSASVAAGQQIGFVVTITNTGTEDAAGVALDDPLPGFGDLAWSIASQSDSAGSNTFSISGAQGKQVLTLTNNGSVTLQAGEVLTVHITSPTTAADGNGGSAPPANSFDPTGTAAAGVVTLGTAANYAVLGLANTKINNSLVTIYGNEGVSKGGALTNMAPSVITGNVYQYASRQYSGPGTLNGSIITDAALLNQNDTDALAASAAAKALSATQTFSTISTATTITGNGGLNVIAINGNIKLGGSNSLILKGTASDVFIVNIKGTLSINGSSRLGLAGGVTPNHVLYNFTGSSGTIQAQVGNVWFGTILAPKYSYSLDGSYFGELIAGGSSITLMSGAKVFSGSKLINTATVTAGNVTFDSDDAATATMNLTPQVTPLLAGIALSGASQPLLAAGQQLQPGTFTVYVDRSEGSITPAEHARIDDALTRFNRQLRAFGVRFVESGSDHARITIHVAGTTGIGGINQGVLAAEEAPGDITLVSGWDWYTGANPKRIGAKQYDFETVVAHELGHSIGLGHSTDRRSVMFASLSMGQARRQLSAADLRLIARAHDEALLAVTSTLNTKKRHSSLVLGGRAHRRS